MKSNSNAASTTGHALHAALHHDDRIGLAGLLERRGEALRIFLLVLEFQAVDRHDLGADLEPALGIEQLLDALARRNARVVIALRADVEIVLEIGAIEHRLAGGALDPEALGHGRLLDARRALDARWQELLQPAHRVSLVESRSGPRDGPHARGHTRPTVRWQCRPRAHFPRPHASCRDRARRGCRRATRRRAPPRPPAHPPRFPG